MALGNNRISTSFVIGGLLVAMLPCGAALAESSVVMDTSATPGASIAPSSVAAEPAVEASVVLPGGPVPEPKSEAVAESSSEPAAEPETDVSATPQGEAAAEPKTAPNEWSRADFRPQDGMLAERVEARWAALAKGDFKAAYAYTLPSYRQTHSFEQFASRFGGAVTWRVATVQAIRCDTPQAARVRLALEYEYVPSWGGEAEKLVTRLHETWLDREGEWWLSVSK